ncbi:MAG: hypothetical protein UV53_C0004G0034 [Candidatus Azambacteria bacterium GW2011_GWE1_42_9]|nr:MAG: hypothetical protein UU33_C0001G0329 [Candidatus Azambacteria bacterium GW2011_GWF1_41_10]KKS49363.1 MAG: hypothetical protein UV14_C0001G0109 [Candidatus Azambacteria bacterium GW2011_GWF2_42_22]KKS68817.1 MAG: hypothetical protein UV39_C0031G0002 [Candidatus Azambacteria bacterium GW2011_GWA2_42_62]KKS73491.1 MAG: hypothetical protein UV45_C0034G0002 [Candidatus Azambacteria bacterium GW2011_GWB1_42_72]KKS79604.1 MAG: hypothetical protein UV53_C0004G0034 [Candidatus Azambacteria bacte
MKKAEIIILLIAGIFLLYTGYRFMNLPLQSPPSLWRIILIMLVGAGGLLALCDALYKIINIKKPQINTRLQSKRLFG